MPAEKRIVPDAICLHLAPTGERFVRVQLFAKEHGLLSVLKRKSNQKNRFSIDLFDQGEAHLDLKNGGESQSGFLNDFFLQKKRSGLGKSYTALRAASWLSGLIARNPLHEEINEDLFALLTRALDALDQGQPCYAVMLKTLYIFARDEGYPILEDWSKRLSPDLYANVSKILNSPLAQINLDEDQQQSAYDSLARYIEAHTHIHLPTY
ncbi:hypothetical protein [Pelagicoccus albus]|uniref:Recombination protein O n=1 Tax=Pelagicoccus albus TaxID=415222 RepID=A0A7X1B2T7_9BACT|nr:hypothetical protein [Pelagicoccus albus]MBC2604616.1 hypothetical protein [Pelagicoccus albus]